MRPLFSKLLPNVFLTRRPPYNCTAEIARRQAYAMGGWSETKTSPADEENLFPEPDLSQSVRGEEQIPKSFLAGDDHRGSAQGTREARERSATLRVTEMAEVISEPKRALQEG
jgi:hypothetical protein